MMSKTRFLRTLQSRIPGRRSQVAEYGILRLATNCKAAMRCAKPCLSDEGEAAAAPSAHPGSGRLPAHPAQALPLSLLSANAAEVGDNQSVHEATMCGTGGEVALNVSLLAEGIDA